MGSRVARAESFAEAGNLSPCRGFVEAKRWWQAKGVCRAVMNSIAAPDGLSHRVCAAFEANALAYLLKPIEAERLSVAIERSNKLCSLSAEKQKERESILRARGEAPKTLRKIVCRKDERALLVPSEQILWFQVQDGIVHATTVKDSSG